MRPPLQEPRARARVGDVDLAVPGSTATPVGVCHAKALVQRAWRCRCSGSRGYTPMSAPQSSRPRGSCRSPRRRGRATASVLERGSSAGSRRCVPADQRNTPLPKKPIRPSHEVPLARSRARRRPSAVSCGIGRRGTASQVLFAPMPVSDSDHLREPARLEDRRRARRRRSTTWSDSFADERRAREPLRAGSRHDHEPGRIRHDAARRRAARGPAAPCSCASSLISVCAPVCDVHEEDRAARAIDREQAPARTR